MFQSRGAVLAALLIAVLVALAIAYPPERTGEARSDARAMPAFTAQQEREIRDTVRRYLLENPGVIVDALEARQRASADAQFRRTIAESGDELFRAANDPFIGNPDATVTVVEFFDYQCPYCKQVAKDVVALVGEDADLKVVFKEFPVFGDESALAARAALAADRQGKYVPFHLALMSVRGRPTQAMIDRLAQTAGLDLARLHADMQSPEIDAVFEANYALARRLGVTGTPAFVIGDQLIPGAIDKASLQELIAAQRKD